MNTRYYSMCLDSYSKNLSNGFSSLQQEEEFVDLTLAADGHLVKVHKNIVAVASPYLKEMIKTASCQSPVIFLNNVSHKILNHIIEYIYTGETHIPQKNIKEFINISKSLHIKGIENFLSVPENLVPIDADKPINAQVEDTFNDQFYSNEENNLNTDLQAVSDEENKLDTQATSSDDTSIINQLNTANNVPTNDVAHNTNKILKKSKYKNMSMEKRLPKQAIRQTIPRKTKVKKAPMIKTYSDTKMPPNVVVPEIEEFPTTEISSNNVAFDTDQVLNSVKTFPTTLSSNNTAVHSVYPCIQITPQINQAPLIETYSVTQLPPNNIGPETNQIANKNFLFLENPSIDIASKANVIPFGSHSINQVPSSITFSEITNNNMTLEPNVVPIIENYPVLQVPPDNISNNPAEIIVSHQDTGNGMDLDDIVPAFNIEINHKINENQPQPESSSNIEIIQGKNMDQREDDISNSIQIKYLDNVPDSSEIEPLQDLNDIDVGDLKNMSQYSVTERGALQIILNRFIYCCHHSSKGGWKRRWRCIDYRKLSCPAYLDTKDGLIVKRIGVHSHAYHDSKIYKKHERGLIFHSIERAEDASKQLLK